MPYFIVYFQNSLLITTFDQFDDYNEPFFLVSDPWGIFRILGCGALQFSVKMRGFLSHYFLKHFSLSPTFSPISDTLDFSELFHYLLVLGSVYTFFYVSFIYNHFTHNLHTIKFVLLNCTIVFGTFTKLCKHHHYLIPDIFITPKRNHILQQSFPSPPYPCPCQTVMYFVSMDLPNTDISNNWKHTLNGLYIRSSLLSMFFKTHSCCSLYRYFFLLLNDPLYLTI